MIQSHFIDWIIQVFLQLPFVALPLQLADCRNAYQQKSFFYVAYAESLWTSAVKIREKTVHVSGHFWECEHVILLPLRNYCWVAGHHTHTYHRRGRVLMTQRGHTCLSCSVLKADSDIILNFRSETLGLGKIKVKLNPAQFRYLAGQTRFRNNITYTTFTENMKSLFWRVWLIRNSIYGWRSGIWT